MAIGPLRASSWGERVDFYPSAIQILFWTLFCLARIFTGSVSSSSFNSHHKQIMPSPNISSTNDSARKQTHISFCPGDLAVVLESPHSKMKLIIFSLLHYPNCPVSVSGTDVQQLSLAKSLKLARHTVNTENC